MTNKVKFLSLVSSRKTDTIERNDQRVRDREMLHESQRIAISVLKELDDRAWTQAQLAERMKVSPQHVSKVLRGKENLTLETLIKLQSILDIPILASFYEINTKGFERSFFSFKMKDLNFLEESANQIAKDYPPGKVFKSVFDFQSAEC